jgi:hypothetical protein
LVEIIGFLKVCGFSGRKCWKCFGLNVEQIAPKGYKDSVYENNFSPEVSRVAWKLFK